MPKLTFKQWNPFNQCFRPREAEAETETNRPTDPIINERPSSAVPAAEVVPHVPVRRAPGRFFVSVELTRCFF